MKFSVVFSFFVNFIVFSQTNVPNVFSIDPNLLFHTRELVKSQSSKVMPAYKRLIEDADRMLKKDLYSVMDKEKIPPSGDKHDYLSISIYSWPNPKTKNGLPYITKDGEVNPESKKGTNAQAMVNMCESSFTLALAYYLSKNEKYAEHAADILRIWFLNHDTKMNPNLNYAQIVPGKNTGSPGGIIDSRNFIYVTEAAGLLEGSSNWHKDDNDNLTAWFKDYLHWLETDTNGIVEGKTKNNHLTFYKAQIINYTLFIGNKDEALKQIESVKDLILNQIDPDGSQPYELKRTKSFNYSVFNLQAFFLLAEMGKNAGVDLYSFASATGSSLRKAVDFVAPFVDSTKQWPYQELGSISAGKFWLGELLRIASIRYQDDKYAYLLKDNYGKPELSKQWILLYPE